MFKRHRSAAVLTALMLAATAAHAADTVANPYGLDALWKGGDFIARGTLLILMIMSMGSWYLIVAKLLEQARALRYAKSAAKHFWKAGNLAEGASQLDAGSPFRYIAESGLSALDNHHGALLDQVDLNSWTAAAIERASNVVSSRLQDGLAFLGTVGSTAPFIGLFGTVVGILNAFQQIATQKTSGIGAVAGGISEALVTTAFGLLVAIPAVMTFNYFTGKVEAFDVEMDNSSSELIDYFIKQSHRR